MNSMTSPVPPQVTALITEARLSTSIYEGAPTHPGSHVGLINRLVAALEAAYPTTTDDSSRETLVAWWHARNEFDYDECQHGTYSGGPIHGEPYKMCERQADALLSEFSVGAVPPAGANREADRDSLGEKMLRAVYAAKGWVLPDQESIHYMVVNTYGPMAEVALASLPSALPTTEQIIDELDRHVWQIWWGDDHRDTGGIKCSCREWSALQEGIYRPQVKFEEHRREALAALLTTTERKN